MQHQDSKYWVGGVLSEVTNMYKVSREFQEPLRTQIRDLLKTLPQRDRDITRKTRTDNSLLAVLEKRDAVEQKVNAQLAASDWYTSQSGSLPIPITQSQSQASYVSGSNQSGHQQSQAGTSVSGGYQGEPEDLGYDYKFDLCRWRQPNTVR